MRKPHKMVNHTQTIRRLLLTNFFSVFDHFVGLALKGLRVLNDKQLNKTKENNFHQSLDSSKNSFPFLAL